MAKKLGKKFDLNGNVIGNRMPKNIKCATGAELYEKYKLKGDTLRFYKTKILHDEYLERETNEFIEEVYNGKAGELIASLCKSRISESDYGELMKLLEKYGEK